MEHYDIIWEAILKKRNLVGRDKTNLQYLFEEITIALGPDLVLEIGAHDAHFSQNISRKMTNEKNDTSIVAYEANETVYNKYVEDLSPLFEYRFNLVAGDRRTRSLITPTKMSQRETSRSLSPANRISSMLSHTKTLESVETIFDCPETIDIIVDEFGAQKTVIWADVEGACGEILFGGKKSLSSGRIAALYLEVEKKETWAGQWTCTEIRRLLAGYDMTPVVRDYQTADQFNEIYIHNSLLNSIKKIYEKYIEELV